jgi:glutamate synthase domain-containing protein 3
MVRLTRIGTNQEECATLHDLIQQHAEATESPHAARILSDWQSALEHFWKVVPLPAG